MSKQASKTSGKRQRIPAWEWVVAAMGASLVACLLAFMGYRAMRGDTQVPDFQIGVQEIQSVNGGYVVALDIRNTGGGAANVAIEGTLSDGGNTIESSGVTVDYVPADSRREAGLMFTQDPSRHRLQLRATGYESP
ncbi:MAG: hypothetical protein M3Q96_08890 [Pseudomonadota bacterium]|nr:hypothetical protein [Pseudomonadota bacterium]MDQ3229756.1 hypothetical protein [Pseudomonadota bacterium]